MKKILSILLALTVLLGTWCFALPSTAYAASSSELAAIQEKKADLKKQIEEAKANKEEALQQKYLMDQRNAVLQEEIDLVNSKISDTEARIADNEAQEEEQYALFCRQVREQEERGSVSYWSVLFKATSFADLLSRVDFINEVADYDQGVIDQLQQLRQQLAEDKESLEADKSELDATQAELKQQISEAEALAAGYAETESGLQAMYDAEAEAAEQMDAELRAAAASRQSSGSSSYSSVPTSSGYIWPTNDTRVITSPVGGRASPGGIGSTNHKGVDIGASYGSEILASKAGVVVQSGWYGGYGYCVTIQHGSNSGTYTRYGHMSRIAVSEGQTVSQGQVIGYCGSTGNSTGPHIHFEIHEDGVLKNPLDYLPGYIAAW